MLFPGTFHFSILSMQVLGVKIVQLAVNLVQLIHNRSEALDGGTVCGDLKRQLSPRQLLDLTQAVHGFRDFLNILEQLVQLFAILVCHDRVSHRGHRLDSQQWNAQIGRC